MHEDVVGLLKGMLQVRLQVLMAATMKMTDFWCIVWDITHHPDNRGRKHF
jgi:hypothetical protein